VILAILQARMSSTRLPGKVLKPILGRPLLSLQIERIGRSREIDKLVVATSTDEVDQQIVELCKSMGVAYYTGSLDDVLDRFYRAASVHKPDHIVRLTGDCPLTDPVVIDQVIDFYLEGQFDYASNTIQPTYPDGLDVEVFSFDALEQAWQEARLTSEREHVTPFLYTRRDRFQLGNHKGSEDLSHQRWTVDEPEDFEFVKAIYENLYDKKPGFTMADILELLARRPELSKINQHLRRNEGYLKSLAGDRKAFSQ
jgi:spore coat polysaccharide biosynthesis protein SpsF